MHFLGVRIMSKSRIKNKYLKWPSRENYLAYKKIKNKCNNLVNKMKKRYFQENASKGSASSKSFWNKVKSFISSRGTLSNDNIIIEAPTDTTLTIKGGNLVSIKAKDGNILVKMFNNHYINIVEKSSGPAPKSIGNKSNPDHHKCTVQNIIQYYKNHPSLIKIKENFKNLAPFDFPKPTIEDISSIIKLLNPRKATCSDFIPLKVIKFASGIIDSHPCNITIKNLEKTSI